MSKERAHCEPTRHLPYTGRLACAEFLRWQLRGETSEHTSTHKKEPSHSLLFLSTYSFYLATTTLYKITYYKLCKTISSGYSHACKHSSSIAIKRVIGRTSRASVSSRDRITRLGRRLCTACTDCPVRHLLSNHRGLFVFLLYHNCTYHTSDDRRHSGGVTVLEELLFALFAFSCHYSLATFSHSRARVFYFIFFCCCPPLLVAEKSLTVPEPSRHVPATSLQALTRSITLPPLFVVLVSGSVRSSLRGALDMRASLEI